jgi:hypothetical protein
MFTAFTISESSKNLYRVAVEKREEAKSAVAKFVECRTLFSQKMTQVENLTSRVNFLKTRGSFLSLCSATIALRGLQNEALIIKERLEALDHKCAAKIFEAQLAFDEVKMTPEAEGINVADCPASPSCVFRVPLSTVARRATTGAPAPVSP